MRLMLPNRSGEIQPRIRAAVAILVLVFGIIGWRLWYLQVVKGDEYFRFAAQNSFKAREVPAPRGMIFGQHNQRIADVRPSFDVIIRPAYIHRGDEDRSPHDTELVPDIHQVARRLALILEIDPQVVEDYYSGASGRARFRPIVIKGDVSRDEIALIEANRIDLPGVDIQVSQKRTYPHGEMFSHLVGYLGEVRTDELTRLKARYAAEMGEDYYEIGDYIGKYGVEKAYEDSLKGRDGIYYVQEDATGRLVMPGDEVGESDYARTMLAYLEQKRRPEVPGSNLHLTIDVDLQARVKAAMGGKAGVVVAMEPDTGRILAMVNSPSFDPEIFVRGISLADWEILRSHPDRPLEDKALRGQYPPGSTFKMITAAAALMEGVTRPETKVFCGGTYKVGQRRFRCWKWASGGHGLVDVHQALVQSCDTYFYQVGLKLGIDRLARYMSAFGLGRPTGLGLNQEKNGLVPTEAWKLSRFGQAWLPGETAAASIGQGHVLVTPLQLVRMVSAIANGGHLMKPYVVERITSPEGQDLEVFSPREEASLPVDARFLREIQLSMLDVVASPRGTGYANRIRTINMAGKTGTAQVVKQDIKELQRKEKSRYDDHAWFVAYAPFEHPEIAVTVLVEHGGHGGAVAAPIAREVIKWYLKDRYEAPPPGGDVPIAPPVAAVSRPPSVIVGD